MSVTNLYTKSPYAQKFLKMSEILNSTNVTIDGSKSKRIDALEVQM